MENLKELIKLKFNIQESGKMRNFLGVYYSWGHDEKGPHTKITMEKDTKKLFGEYEKFTGKYVKVKENAATDTTLRKIELKEPRCITITGHLWVI